jgi:hypothetical protein
MRQHARRKANVVEWMRLPPDQLHLLHCPIIPSEDLVPVAHPRDIPHTDLVRVAFMESPRVLVGVALKTLGLGSNARRADLAPVGASDEDLCSKILSSASK